MGQIKNNMKKNNTDIIRLYIHAEYNKLIKEGYSDFEADFIIKRDIDKIIKKYRNRSS
jgi:uncharacterized membrane-anchored protein